MYGWICMACFTYLRCFAKTALWCLGCAFPGMARITTYTRYLCKTNALEMSLQAQHISNMESPSLYGIKPRFLSCKVVYIIEKGIL